LVNARRIVLARNFPTSQAVSRFSKDRIVKIHHDLHRHLPSNPALRVKALESILIEKGLIDSQSIDAWVEAFSDEIGPKRGAQVVARAWVDPHYKARLLADAPAALDELGYLGYATSHLIVVQNTDHVHNLVVCTLCSCYPLSILGIPPNWYKTAAYRSRAVRDPRGVLAEFGVLIDDQVEIRVWDSTAELRYMVLPQRPEGTEGWTEAKLAGLVTRNSMIGTHRDLTPRFGDAS
jgi:nitrile hydratase